MHRHVQCSHDFSRFRWAVCQLDILRRLSTAQDIRAALQHMPETLAETYERTFDAIPAQERSIVQRAVAIICGHPVHSVRIEILIALIWENWGQTTKDSPILCDPDSLQGMCGCLITTSDNGFVTLAHFTVKEFLYSAHAWTTQSEAIRTFRLNDEIAAITFLITALRGAITIEDDMYLYEPQTRLKDHCIFFGCCSLMHWHASLAKGGLQPLGHRFLDPEARHYKLIPWSLLNMTINVLENGEFELHKPPSSPYGAGEYRWACRNARQNNS